MKRVLLIVMLALVPFFGICQPAERACFSVPGGFYENIFPLELFPLYPQHHIRFTVNGNRPTAQSRLYTAPLLLDESFYSTSDIYTIQTAPEELMYYPDSVSHCIVIRAAVFDENDSCISGVATNSYFIHSLGCDTHDLPVVSLCADTLDLFGYENGILVPGVFWDPANPNWTGNYYQTGDDWERTINVEFYETDNTGINQCCGLRTHGGNARRFQQKGMKIYARSIYGKNSFDHRFFDDIPLQQFKRLVLKPFSSSWTQSGITNHVCNQIARNVNVETLADRPAVLFLNGEYWGVYFVSEKPDDHYIEAHFDISHEEVNIMSNWFSLITSGTNLYFDQFCSWLQTADLNDNDQWDYVKAHVDVDCFIDYQILEIFLENLDWPANNMRCWQHNDGMWRWIFFDGDGCLTYMTFDVFANAVYDGPDTWPSCSQATLFLRKFLENQEFRERFYDRFNVLMDSVFQYDMTQDYVISIKTAIQSEVPCEIARFGFPESMDRWNSGIGLHLWFLRRRVADMRERFNIFWEPWESVEEKPENKDLEVFPNPCSDRLTLRFNVTSPTTTELRIFNLLGQEVYSKPLVLEIGFNEVSVEMPPSLSSGVYVLKTDRFIKKIVCK